VFLVLLKRPTIHFLLAVALLATARNASAYRYEFFVQHDGKRVPHAEICFFAAAAPRDIYPRFFASADVACLSADDVIEIPPGKWNFYARFGSSLISNHPGYVTYDGPPRREMGYKGANVDLVAAATIDMSAWLRGKQEGDSIVVYADAKSDTKATAFPLSSADNTVVVPAGVSLTTLLIRARRPIQVGVTVVLSPGETYVQPLPVHVKGFADIVLATTLVRTIAEQVERFDMPPPVFRLRTTKGEIHEPLTSAANAASLDLTIVVFRNVPVGTAVLSVSGYDWESVESFVSVEEPVTVLEDVALSPAGRLRLEVSGARSDIGVPSPRVAIFRCENISSQAGPCPLFLEYDLAGVPKRTSFDMGSLPSGMYEVRLVDRPSHCWPVLIWPGRESMVVITE
jgi:hypothetical protein